MFIVHYVNVYYKFATYCNFYWKFWQIIPTIIDKSVVNINAVVVELQQQLIF